MVVLSELLRLAGASYTQRTCIGRWQLVRRYNQRRGFVATQWTANDSADVVLSVRGTKSATDCLQDLRLLFGREPIAWREGRSALHAARKQCGAGGRLYLTGHSIGGAYASALGAESGTKTVTFNAPGMREALRRAGTHEPWLERDHATLLNVCSARDFIWRLSGPGLSSRVLIVDQSHRPPIDNTGVRGVLDAWRQRKSTRGFTRHALRCHGLRSFIIEGRSDPWARSMDSLFGRG